MIARAALVALVALAACAKGTSGGDDDGPGVPDGAVGAADAPVGVPDADPVGGPADANLCPTAPCDLVQQCGCEAPTVCDLDLGSLPNTACRAVSSPGMETATCTALSQCAGGYVCVSGSCSRYCAVDADCGGDPRRKCIVTLQSDGVPIDGATTCSAGCEPPNAAAGGCPAGHACRLAFEDPDGTGGSGDEIPFMVCGTAGATAAGGACTSNANCQADHLCINTGTTTCHRLCTLTPAGGECTSGTCTGLVPAMLIAGKEYGACI